MRVKKPKTATFPKIKKSPSLTKKNTGHGDDVLVVARKTPVNQEHLRAKLLPLSCYTNSYQSSRMLVKVSSTINVSQAITDTGLTDDLYRCG